MLNRYKKISIFTLIVVLPLFCFSQKFSGMEKPVFPVDLRRAVSSFNCGKIEAPDTSFVRKYLLSNLPNLKGESFSLEYLEGRQSKTGLHYLYRQNYLGTPVYRGTIKINLDDEGNILSLFDNTYPISSTPAGDFPTSEDSYDIVKAFYHDENELVKILVENLYFDEGSGLVPASRIELWDKRGNFFEIIINSDATVIYERDMNNYFNKQATYTIDTPALARIFNPDPLTTAGVTYGAPYEDGSDVDISQLNLQRQQVTIDVTFSNDSFRLESPYCKILNSSARITSDFQYTRAQDGFEDANAFYHINTYHSYIQQLGFNDLVNYPIWVDTHASVADNSSFNGSSSPPRLSFGTGGVDDAEDADVIIHEYGHAISHSAAPGTNTGGPASERTALDEALGDYFAASYSKSINDLNWGNVFSWDGHNEFWDGRVVISEKHYPESLAHHLYKDAELWSATMMQIMDNIGRENTDEVQIEALYSYATGMTMTDAANLVIQADVLLHGGEFVLPIRYWMCSRGFIPCGVGIDEKGTARFNVYNSYGFARNNENAVVKFDSPQDGYLQLTDAAGRIIHSQAFLGSEEVIVSPEMLSSGIYLIKITSQTINGCFKLTKL